MNYVAQHKLPEFIENLSLRLIDRMERRTVRSRKIQTRIIFRIEDGFITWTIELFDVIQELLSFGGSPIKKPPGYRVLQLAEFFCSPKTMDQVFEPLVADWQEEYFQALNRNRRLKSRWISLRYIWKAVLAFGLSKLLAAVRAFSTKR